MGHTHHSVRCCVGSGVLFDVVFAFLHVFETFRICSWHSLMRAGLNFDAARCSLLCSMFCSKGTVSSNIVIWLPCMWTRSGLCVVGRMCGGIVDPAWVEFSKSTSKRWSLSREGRMWSARILSIELCRQAYLIPFRMRKDGEDWCHLRIFYIS